MYENYRTAYSYSKPGEPIVRETDALWEILERNPEFRAQALEIAQRADFDAVPGFDNVFTFELSELIIERYGELIDYEMVDYEETWLRLMGCKEPQGTVGRSQPLTLAN